MKNIAIFLCGIAIGSAVTWKITSEKYNKIVDEEIKSVKETFKKYRDDKKEEQKPKVEEVKYIEKDSLTKELKVYNRIREQYNITSEQPKKEEYPCVISPDEFGEIYGYDTISLTYYADGVLCDDNNDIIENIDYIIGSEALDTFGRFEDDSVHVRNDKLKVYYEILKDERNFEDL